MIKFVGHWIMFLQARLYGKMVSLYWGLYWGLYWDCIGDPIVIKHNKGKLNDDFKIF